MTHSVVIMATTLAICQDIFPLAFNQLLENSEFVSFSYCFSGDAKDKDRERRRTVNLVGLLGKENSSKDSQDGNQYDSVFCCLFRELITVYYLKMILVNGKQRPSSGKNDTRRPFR